MNYRLQDDIKAYLFLKTQNFVHIFEQKPILLRQRKCSSAGRFLTVKVAHPGLTPRLSTGARIFVDLF